MSINIIGQEQWEQRQVKLYGEPPHNVSWYFWDVVFSKTAQGYLAAASISGIPVYEQVKLAVECVIQDCSSVGSTIVPVMQKWWSRMDAEMSAGEPFPVFDDLCDDINDMISHLREDSLEGFAVDSLLLAQCYACSGELIANTLNDGVDVAVFMDAYLQPEISFGVVFEHITRSELFAILNGASFMLLYELGKLPDLAQDDYLKALESLQASDRITADSVFARALG